MKEILKYMWVVCGIVGTLLLLVSAKLCFLTLCLAGLITIINSDNINDNIIK